MYVIPVIGNVIEIGPLELTRWSGVQQQALQVKPGGGVDSGQSPQSVDDPDSGTMIEDYKPRTNQRSAIAETLPDRVARKAEKGRKLSIPEAGARHPFEQESGETDILDNLIDCRLRLFAKQQFQDVYVGTIEVGGFCQASDASRCQVRLCALGLGTLLLQDLLETAQLC